MRKLIFLLLLLAVTVQTWADGKVTLTAEAPEVVVSGDQFRLTFTVNSQSVKDFRAPSITKGFEVLMGPSRSQQYGSYTINGKTVVNKSVTYTYILMAGDAGTYTIPAASIQAEGEKIFSNSLQVKVLPPDKTSNSSNGGSKGSANSSRNQAAGSRITDKDLFMLATANKTTVHEQEAILLTYKLYSTVNLQQLNEDMPELTGFHTQEIDLPQKKVWSMEHYQGHIK